MGIKLGWAKREFSISDPVNINGQMYMRRSNGIFDELYTTALCIDGGKGNDIVIFCSLDVTVLRSGIITDVVEKVLEKRPEIPADNIILNATHTHSSMDYSVKAQTFPDGASLTNSDVTKPRIVEKAVEAIIEAYDTRKAGAMGYGYGYAVVAHSRRSTYGEDMSVKNPNAVAPNGNAIMYGRTSLPEFWGYEAGADHFLNAMFTFDENKKLTGIIINIPCPSQLSEHFRMVTADYWTDVRRAVAKEFGEDVFVLPQCAAAGDLSPRTLHYLPAQERRFMLKYGEIPGYSEKILPTKEEYQKVLGERRDIAERVINSVKEIYSWAKSDIKSDIPVRHEKCVIPLKRRFITEDEVEWCKENMEKMKDAIPDTSTATPEEITVAVSRYNSIKGRNERAIDRFNRQNENPTLDSIIHCVQVGEIAFCTTRFELYMDYMHRIQGRSPFVQTFFIELAGDMDGSYLPTERAKNNKGYSASLFCNQVGPEGGQQIVETTLGILNSFYEKDNKD